jgi:hypothetical protein
VLDVEEVVEAASRLGALETAGPFLSDLGVQVVPGAAPRALQAELEAWNVRVRSARARGAGQLYALSRAPLHSRPAMLWNLIWPSDDQMRIKTQRPGGSLIAARLRRLLTGARALPRAFRVLLDESRQAD